MEKKAKGVRLEKVTKIYRDYKTKKEFAAVDKITLDIAPGSFATLLGPSGCGKTTTLRMIAGFESPDAGEIFLGETAINSLMPNKRDTAMVFQSYALLPHYNVFDNVAYGLKVRRVPKDEIKTRVMKMLDLVELSGLESRKTNQLSGGQQQRVALARALVVEPSVLLFDEPLSNLDAKLRVAMRTEIRRIQQTVGITAIYVTHDQAEAMSISDTIIIMNNGKIAQMGSPKEIYYNPRNEFVADFIGEANFMSGIVKSVSENEMRIDANGTEIISNSFEQIAVGEKCKLVVRPESISLRENFSVGENSGTNGNVASNENGAIPCEVIVSTFMGSYHYYQVRAHGETIKITDYNSRAHKIFSVGEKAFLHFDSNNLHVVD